MRIKANCSPHGIELDRNRIAWIGLEDRTLLPKATKLA